MKKIKILLTISLIVFSTSGYPASCSFAAQVTMPPYTGVITGESVNIRSGPGTSFEVLRKMNKGEVVLVLDTKLDWYKIKLPRNTKAFVHAQFIVVDNDVYGHIKADRVNVRAGEGTNFNVIGQLNKQDFVEILDRTKGWYHIFPDNNCFAWVQNNFVKKHASADLYLDKERRNSDSFKLLLEAEKFEEENKTEAVKNNSYALIIEKYSAILRDYANTPAIKRTQAHIDRLKSMHLKVKKTPLKKNSVKQAKISPTPTGEPIAQGIIVEAGRFLNRPGTHKLIENKQLKYFLKSSVVDINKYVQYQVQIWGTIKTIKGSKTPLIEVDAIKKLN